MANAIEVRDLRKRYGALEADVLTLGIWLVVGVFLMIRFLRQSLGER